MKKMILLLFLCGNIYSIENIDSLLIQSQKASSKANLRGLFINHQQRLTPPEVLFKLTERDRFVAELPRPADINNVDRIKALESSVAEMSLNIEKLTFISKNLISQSESHSKNSNLLIKLIEIVMTTLGTIIVGYFSTIVFKKKK